MANKNAPKHKPKETTTYSAIDETRTFDGALKRGHSELHIENTRRSKRKDILKDPESKQKLMDFIFGKAEENPLNEISEEFSKKKEHISTKEKFISITSIYDRNSKEKDEDE